MQKQKIWFTGDLNYGNLGAIDPKYIVSRDDFSTIEEHDSFLVERINEYVGADDRLYVLGNWSGGDVSNIWKFRTRVNCQEVHLILGPRDVRISQNLCLDKQLRYGHGIKEKYAILRAANLFTSVSNNLFIKVGRQELLLTYYPQLAWDNSEAGAYHLFGYGKNTLGEQHYRTMDVGIDNYNFRPYSYDEITDILHSRPRLVPEFDRPKQTVNLKPFMKVTIPAKEIKREEVITEPLKEQTNV